MLLAKENNRKSKNTYSTKVKPGNLPYTELEYKQEELVKLQKERLRLNSFKRRTGKKNGGLEGCYYGSLKEMV